MASSGEAVKSAFSRSGVSQLQGDNMVVSSELLGKTLKMLETDLSHEQLGQVIELGEQNDGHVDIDRWVDRIFSKPQVGEAPEEAYEEPADADAAATSTMTQQQKFEPGAQDHMIRLPTPARQCQDANSLCNHRSDHQVAVELHAEFEAPSALLTLSCYECLAFFLDVQALWRLSCSCTALRSEFTVVAPDDANVKLLVPVLELKGHSSESMTDLAENGYSDETLLEHVATPRVRILRIWQRGAFEAVAGVVRSGGPRQWQSLERIAVKGCPLFQEDFGHVFTPIFSITGGLKHLNLEKNQVNDGMLEEFVSSGAFAAAQLESLNLRFNRITAKGAAALASCEAGFTRMLWTNMKMNQLGDAGVAALAEMLRRNTSLTMLNVRRQFPPLTDKSAASLADALLQNSTLEQLRLRKNRIGDAGASALASALRQRLARPGQCNQQRFELDLEENRISAAGGLSLLRALQSTGTTKRLQIGTGLQAEVLLHGNSFAREDLARVAQDSGNAGALAIDDDRIMFASKAESAL